MEIRQLQYFLAVARELNFTRAAERLFVAQPGVSSQIAQLERELGSPLFDRTSRQVELTDLGRWLLPKAENVLLEINELANLAKEHAGNLSGTVHFGCVHSLRPASVPISRVVATFLGEYPHANVRTVHRPTGELIEGVRKGTLDLAIAGGPAIGGHGLESHTLVRTSLSVVTRRDEQEAVDAPLQDLSALSRSQILSLSDDTPVRDEVDKLLRDAGLQVRYDSANPSNVLELVEEGLGHAVLPQGLVDPTHQNLIEIPVDKGIHSGVELILLWPSNRSPTSVAERFRQLLLEELKRDEPEST